MEGQESYELDPSQGTLQKVLVYVHIPMYTTIGGISVYVRGYRHKIHVYHFSYVFRDDQGHIKMFLGMIKDTSKDKKWSIGANESVAGQGKAIQCVIHLVW